MRNLKKLLAVIVAVCTILTFTVPAFAAEAASISADAQIAKDLGVLKGDSSLGVTDTYLAKGTTRIQAATLYLRLIGKEQAAYDSTPATNFADADKAGYANGKKLLGYLRENPDLGWAGVSADKFDPQGAASAQMIYKVVLEALGYKAGTDFQWADTITFAAGKGLTKVADVTKLTNDATATALVEALKATVKGGTDTLAAKLVAAGTIDKAAAIAAGLVADKVTATAAATGAKKLTITFNAAVDSTKAVIAVARGTVKPSVKSVTFADDKKSAVVEFTTALAEGDYTVTVTGLGDAATATVKVAAEKLTAIKFLSDNAIISGNNVTSNVKAENQYGEDVTSKLTSANVTISKGSSASISDKGVLTIVGTSGLFSVDDKVVVAIVDAGTGVVATKTLIVAKSAAVDSIEFGTIATDDKDLKDKEINVTAMTTNASKYYMPIKVKDQYGNVLKAADLAYPGFALISSNANIAKIATPASIVDDDKLGTLIKFQSAGGSATNGTVVITAVASVTGKTASTSFVVKENAKLDVVTLSAPATEVKLNTAVVLPVSVVDTYGKEVALKDITLNASTPGEITLNSATKITASNGTFSVSNDYVKDVTSIKITPTAKTVVVTVTTATGKYQTLTLTASDAPVVSGIKDVKSDFDAMMANQTDVNSVLTGNVEFVDQYGESIDAPTYKAAKADGAASYYTIEKKDNAATTTTFTASSGTIAATTTAGAETYVVTLYDKDSKVLDSYEEEVTVVNADDITAYTIDDLNKFYTGGAVAAYNQQVKIHGLVDGKKVKVSQTMIQNVTANNGLAIAGNGAYTAQAINSDDKDATSTLTVIVANAKNTYVVTKDVVYSEVAPKAASLAIQLDEKDVTGAVQITPVTTNNIVTTGTDKLKIFAKDQYGVVMTSGYTFVITNNDTTATISINGSGVISISGTPTVGKSFQIYAIIDGISKSIKVIVE